MLSGAAAAATASSNTLLVPPDSQMWEGTVCGLDLNQQLALHVLRLREAPAGDGRAAHSKCMAELRRPGKWRWQPPGGMAAHVLVQASHATPLTQPGHLHLLVPT